MKWARARVLSSLIQSFLSRHSSLAILFSMLLTFAPHFYHLLAYSAELLATLITAFSWISTASSRSLSSTPRFGIKNIDCKHLSTISHHKKEGNIPSTRNTYTSRLWHSFMLLHKDKLCFASRKVRSSRIRIAIIIAFL